MAPSGSSSSAQERREAQREELRRQRQAELRRQKRIRTAVISVITVVALVVVFGIGYWIYQSTRPAGPVTAPTGMAADASSYEIGAQKDKPVVDLYLDYMCPVCGQFHQINGDDLDSMIQNDEITLHVHTRTFLDGNSSTGDYSTRAANAAACVWDDDPENFWAFSDLLFGNQPAEGSAGLTNAQLTDYATQAGASDTVGQCITDKTHASWLHEVVEGEAKKTDTNGTPYVLIDGTPFTDWSTPGSLASAVAAAGGSSASDAGGASDGGS